MSCPNFAAERVRTLNRGRPSLLIMDVPNLVVAVGLAIIALAGGWTAVTILRRAARGDQPVRFRGAALAEPRLTALIIVFLVLAAAVMAVSHLFRASTVGAVVEVIAVGALVAASVVFTFVRGRRFRAGEQMIGSAHPNE